MVLIFFLVSFLSSIVGAICGIGGGVFIKPVLDLLQLGGVSTINFLSGCTVLSMSLYSVSKAMIDRDSKVDIATGPPLPSVRRWEVLWGKNCSLLSRAFFLMGKP